MRLEPYRDLGPRRLGALGFAAVASLGALGPLADVAVPTTDGLARFTFPGWTGPGWLVVSAFACALWAWRAATPRWRGPLFVSAFGLAAVLAVAGVARLGSVSAADDGTPISTTLRWGAWVAVAGAAAAFGLAFTAGDGVISGKSGPSDP